MGAIFAVIPRNGAMGAIALAEEAFRRAVARSPYRGVPASITLPQGVLGIQALGEDASLGSEGPWHVALHGWISNWDDLASRFSLHWPTAANPAQRFAIAYARWGEAFLKASRGEFSAIAVDTRDGDVSAIRGHLGTKPLFHMQTDTLLVIATEIRQAMAGCGNLAPLNKGVLIELLAHVSLAREETCWQGVSRVMAAHAVHFTEGTHRGMSRYWLPLAPDHYPKRSLDDLAEELRGLLFQAVERSLPDSKFAVAMSGGLDSTTIWGITTLLAKQGLRKAQGGTPISIVFPDDPHCDESGYIDAMLEYTGSAGMKINASDVNPLDFISEQIDAMDTPVWGTLYHLNLIATSACERGEAVLLLGIGGDEWFQGSFLTIVDDLIRGHLIRSLNDSLGVPVPKGISRLGFLWHNAFRPRNLRSRLGLLPGPTWLSKSARSLLAVQVGAPLQFPPPQKPTAISELYDTLINFCGGEVYEQIEQRAATYGIEVRNPLLSQDLIEFSFLVDPGSHLKESQTKHLLRRAARDYLPEVVRLRPNKTVFDSSYIGALHMVLDRGWIPGAGTLGQEGLLISATVNLFAEKFSRGDTSKLFLWDLYCAERFIRSQSFG
jgi:asparagine synthase (glutamine-hydrolysing)